MIEPDHQATVDFLYLWAPQGPWVLTAIHPDRKGTETATFRPKTEKKMRKWLTERSDKNLYFLVNTPMRDLKSKAKKTDIKSVDWFHVDIDPRAGESLGLEQLRTMVLLTTALPDGVWPPSVVVFSGGGHQGFWKLEEPFVIDGVKGRKASAAFRSAHQAAGWLMVSIGLAAAVPACDLLWSSGTGYRTVARPRKPDPDPWKERS